MVVIRNWSHIPTLAQINREEIRARLGWGPELVVLHAGNIGVKQGMENVVDAAKLAQQNGDPVRFVIMGDGSQRLRLESLAAGLQTVQFLPSLPSREFVEAMMAADVLLVNEKVGMSESAVPSKMTSYFASGNAVLAAVAADGVVASELRTSGAGVVVESGSPPGLLAGALTLGADTDGRRRLGAAGQQFARTVLSRAYALDSYVAWVGDLISADDGVGSSR